MRLCTIQRFPVVIESLPSELVKLTDVLLQLLKTGTARCVPSISFNDKSNYFCFFFSDTFFSFFLTVLFHFLSLTFSPGFGFGRFFPLSFLVFSICFYYFLRRLLSSHRLDEELELLAVFNALEALLEKKPIEVFPVIFQHLALCEGEWERLLALEMLKVKVQALVPKWDSMDIEQHLFRRIQKVSHD